MRIFYTVNTSELNIITFIFLCKDVLGVLHFEFRFRYELSLHILLFIYIYYKVSLFSWILTSTIQVNCPIGVLAPASSEHEQCQCQCVYFGNSGRGRRAESHQGPRPGSAQWPELINLCSLDSQISSRDFEKFTCS